MVLYIGVTVVYAYNAYAISTLNTSGGGECLMPVIEKYMTIDGQKST